MKTHTILGILLALLLSACASEPAGPSLQVRLDNMIGINMNNVFMKFGPADKTLKMAGGKMLYAYINAGAATGTISKVAFRDEAVTESFTPVCKTIYTVNEQNLIEAVSLQGSCS